MTQGTVVAHEDGSIGIVKRVIIGERCILAEVNWLFDTQVARGLSFTAYTTDPVDDLVELGELNV